MLVSHVADQRHEIHGSESVTVVEFMSACDSTHQGKAGNLERGFQANTWRCGNPGKSQRRLGECRRGDAKRATRKN